jgi:hypothetical protein
MFARGSMIETLDAEFGSNTLRVGKDGDSDKLRGELIDMQREARQSGTVSFSAPPGKHDDLVTALALAVFGLRRIGGYARRSSSTKRPQISAAGWT